MVPKNVVIVGGSIAGLLHGLELKSVGSTVTILEQDPNARRSSYHAGLNVGPNIQALLARLDATGVAAGIPAEFVHFAWRRNARLFASVSPREFTNWGRLYRILRANFDGLESKTVPTPPEPRAGDGKVEYLHGKKVTGIRHVESEGVVFVTFVDVLTGVMERRVADLVIGADGHNSTVRQLMEPDVPNPKEYAGYVVWRGTISERLVSKETIEYFLNRAVASIMKRSYVITYVIPNEDGAIEPGERIVNWAWYHNVAVNSPVMTALFTDTAGKVHTNTVPAGLIRPEVWKQQLASRIEQMTVPLAEAISRTTNPFVTRVNDGMAPTPSFCNGRVVLVGDALTTIRPHSALGSDQAAKHCLLLKEVWAGRMTQTEWDAEVAAYGRRMILLSRAIGVLGQGTWLQFLGALCEFLWFLICLWWAGGWKK